jgi:hypothetical protein
MSATGLTVLLALTAGAPLPDRSIFRWQFEPGRSLVFEQTSEVEQEMTVNGATLTQSQQQVFRLRLTPVRDLGNDRWILAFQVEGCRMEIKMQGNTFSFDSDKPDPNSPLAGFFKALVGTELRLTYDRAQGIVAVEGREALLRRLADVDATLRPMLGAILTEESMKEMGAQVLPTLPVQRARVGESWDRKSTLEMGPIGRYLTSTKFTYASSEGGQEYYRVDVQDIRFQPPDPMVKPGALPFQVKESDLKGKGSGEILFDRNRGRLAASSQKITLEGSLTISIGAAEQKLDLKQVQRVTLRPHEPPSK